MYRFRNALPRALFVLVSSLAIGFLLGTSANADDPTPRAIPAARSFPRSFGSYADVVAYATTIARQQNALDLSLAEARASGGEAAERLAALTPALARGGRLFDTELSRDARAVIASLRVDVSASERVTQQLVSAGALTAEASGWRMPTGGAITQRFGPTSLRVEPAMVYAGVSYAHFHEGVDIAGAWAAPVVAPARGRVVFAGRMADGAQIVVLAHDGGVVTLYAHLDDRAAPPPVKAGDEVAAGQRIGTVGNTGISTGMHLHWAAWRDGLLIDPLSLLPH